MASLGMHIGVIGSCLAGVIGRVVASGGNTTAAVTVTPDQTA
jgi:hypothetical protein